MKFTPKSIFRIINFIVCLIFAAILGAILLPGVFRFELLNLLIFILAIKGLNWLREFANHLVCKS